MARASPPAAKSPNLSVGMPERLIAPRIPEPSSSISPQPLSCASTPATCCPELLAARTNLAIFMREMGDLAGARALLPAQLAGMRARAHSEVRGHDKCAHFLEIAERVWEKSGGI